MIVSKYELESQKLLNKLVYGSKMLFSTNKGLIFFLILFEFGIICFLGSFSDPVQKVFGGPLIPVTLPDVDRVSRIIMLYHSLALPFLAVIVLYVLEFFELRQRFIEQVKWSIVAGSILTASAGLTFAYISPYNWVAHGVFLFGLSISFYSGILLLFAIVPTKNFPTTPKSRQGPYIKGIQLEHLNLTIVALAILISTIIGAYVAANFGQGFNAFLAEDFVRRPEHTIFERMIISHLHIMIALLDAVVMLIVFRYSNLSGTWYKIALLLTIPGTIIMSSGAWLVITGWEKSHMVINVGAVFLLTAALILTFGGWRTASQSILGETYEKQPFKIKALTVLKDPIKFGLYFQFIWVNAVVTIPGIYVAFNLDNIFRTAEYLEVEYAFNVGHWHVLATLTAIIILLLTIDYYNITKKLLRSIMGWFLIVGTIISFFFATVYMLRTPNANDVKFVSFILIDIGVTLMVVGIAIFVIYCILKLYRIGESANTKKHTF
jgi:hypothetical protein